MAARPGKKCVVKRDAYLHTMSCRSLSILIISISIYASCTTPKHLSAQPDNLRNFVNDTLFSSAHLGVSVYDPAALKYVYDYQGARYFVPASNTKIFTCYAAMHTLKHILAGMKYYENDTAVYLIPTGDPTLLHRDFPNQPVIRFLQQLNKKVYITNLNWKDIELGRGWSWDDYNDYYMPERNALPVYGNVINWKEQKFMSADSTLSTSVYSTPEVNWRVRFESNPGDSTFHVQRERNANIFHVIQGNEDSAEQDVPFVVNGIQSSLELLKDTTGKDISIFDHISLADPSQKEIWSQPLDSVLRPMMYRSDNFFAEQILLMVSAERTGVMSDAAIIDTLLRTDMSELSQKPVWVDGSGMSRYNLFTPHIFTELLVKMKNEFGMDRIQSIFPSGNFGTLKGYYNNYNCHIYAKTGSMTGVLALSGYFYTKSNRLMIFSILINNYTGSTTKAKRRIEQFLYSLD